MLQVTRVLTAVFAAACLLAACSSGAAEDEGPRIVQPGAPGEPNRVLSEMPEIEPPPPTDADVAFVHAMIAHHAQALEMTRLVPERTSREDVPLFAERIELSQQDEIDLMNRWLEEHSLAAPDEEHGHTGPDGEPMPGMLTDEQMARLEAARGEEFDWLFLRAMHYHHAGAVQMVQDLLEGGDGREPLLWRLANDIDSDQRIEMSRIESMLAEMDAADSDG